MKTLSNLHIGPIAAPGTAYDSVENPYHVPSMTPAAKVENLQSPTGKYTEAFAPWDWVTSFWKSLKNEEPPVTEENVAPGRTKNSNIIVYAGLAAIIFFVFVEGG